MIEKMFSYCNRAIEICLYLLIFCLPFTKAGAEIFVWVAIALWITKRLLGYRTGGELSLLPSLKLNRAIAIFLIVNALTVVISLNFGLSARAFFSKLLKFVFLFFMVIETIDNKRKVKNVLIVLTLSAILIMADAGAQYFRGVDFLRGFPLGRLRASFSSANAFAGWLIMLIPIFLGILAVKQFNSLAGRIKKIALGVLIIIMLICLILTYSRGALFGFVSGLGLICYWVAEFIISFLCDKLIHNIYNK